LINFLGPSWNKLLFWFELAIMGKGHSTTSCL
jgi:hypothetical protein